MSGRALFIDRDGVINDLVFYPSHGEWESPRDAASLHMRPAVGSSLRAAIERQWRVFLITNQPSYAKGKCSLESLQQVHEQVLDQLENEGVMITGSYVCYHHPDSKIAGFGHCECRKPSPYFIQEAARTYTLDLSRSWMIGDQDMDIEAGRRAGCLTALVEYEHSRHKRGKVQPDLTCADLGEVIRRIY